MNTTPSNPLSVSIVNATPATALRTILCTPTEIATPVWS